jgi:hypothetical protein
MFPKQDQLADGPGSPIRVPFGIHQKSGKRYGFIKPNGSKLCLTFNAQMNSLVHKYNQIEVIFHEYWDIGKGFEKHQNKYCKKGEEDQQKMDQAARIKAKISVTDFVSRYVELTPNGHGLCPFHDDHVKSFSVNIEGNYWHCFTGCGGGDIINFWMLWRKCDFKTAIPELEEILF